MILRDYQVKAISDLRDAFAAGYRRPLIVLPTGAGKGEILATVTRSAVDRGNRVVFLVPRRALVKDFSKRLYRYGVNHGLWLGAQTRQTHLPVTVASVDTLHARAKKGRAPSYTIAILDEAHTFLSARSDDVLSSIGNPLVIGATATPCDLQGRPMGKLFDTLIDGPSVAELIERGFLIPPTIYAPTSPKISHEDMMNEERLAEIMSEKKIVGDAVEYFKILNRGQVAVGFAVNCSDGRIQCEAFNEAGIKSEFLDGTATDRERDAVWDRSKRGITKIVWTVGIVSYGFDAPWLKHGVFKRPTESLALALQQFGRLLRPYEDYSQCIFQDHAANTTRIYRYGDDKFCSGFIDEDREWSLSSSKRKRKKSADEELDPSVLPRVCPECKQVARPGARQCPCGYVFSVIAPRVIEQVEGTLTEIKERPKFSDAAYGASNDPAIQRIIEQCKRRGSRPGQVYFLTRDLETARTEYRNALGVEPKQHWHAAILRSLVERSLAKQQISA